MFEANIVGARARDLATAGADLPDDLEAWVNEGYEAL